MQTFEELGKHLQEVRKTGGFSQGDISKVIGLTTPQFVSNIERGLSPPSPNYLAVLANLTGSDLDELIAETNRHLGVRFARQVLEAFDKL